MISFELDPENAEIEIFDQIARHHYSLSLSGVSSLRQIPPENFSFPVDTLFSTRTSSISLPSLPSILIRNVAGKLITSVDEFCEESFPPSVYFFELCAPIKIYLRIESEVILSVDPVRKTHIELGEKTEVLIGARSKHDQPAGTIVVPDDPEAVFAALSTFGSALKTTSPERSYPTLRGHPPLIERGDSLEIPSSLSAPATGVRLELPATYRHAYVAAPLAYYLGAEVVATDSLDAAPRLVTDSGFTHALSSPQGFERECERVLKQVFFLDCLTRTEGLYQVDLHERAVLEDELALDFASLYDRSIGEQVEEYLGVPFGKLRTHLPDWKLTGHVSPTYQIVEVISFLAEDLAIIRSPKKLQRKISRKSVVARDEFRRNRLIRGIDDYRFDLGNPVHPEQANSLEHVWVGKGIVYGASKALPEAYRNRLKRSPSTDPIDIILVCNDKEMSEERDIVESVYGTRDQQPFRVNVQREVSTRELRTLLTNRSDFFHYIGHIDSDGFACTDGKFDASNLETVGIDAFFLNACESYKQGKHLINSGAISGITTLYSVVNSGAVKIGATIARLLNCGFPLRPALEIAKNESTVGYHYLVLGDGGLSIAQPEGNVPYYYDISYNGENFQISVNTYATSHEGMGSATTPHIEGIDKYFLTPGTTPTFTVKRCQLEQFLSLEEVPVKVDGSLQWSSELNLDNIRNHQTTTVD